MLLTCMCMSGQNVAYYRHIKTVAPSGAVTQVSGNKGQFITRNGRACYESRPDGTALEYNGHLLFEAENGGVKTYRGNSYFGQSSFSFDDSRGYLNIRTADGTVHVFRRENAPAGRTSGSYITPRPEPSPSPVYVPVPTPGYDPAPAAPVHVEDPNRPGTRRTCDICHGTRDCQHCNGRGWIRGTTIGGRDRIECSLCRGSGRCIHCHGRGWTRN